MSVVCCYRRADIVFVPFWRVCGNSSCNVSISKCSVYFWWLVWWKLIILFFSLLFFCFISWPILQTFLERQILWKLEEDRPLWRQYYLSVLLLCLDLFYSSLHAWAFAGMHARAPA